MPSKGVTPLAERRRSVARELGRQLERRGASRLLVGCGGRARAVGSSSAGGTAGELLAPVRARRIVARRRALAWLWTHGKATRASTARVTADDDGLRERSHRERSRSLTSRLRLEAGEVHLWWGRMRTVGILDGSRGWLSDEERARGERFRREGGRPRLPLQRRFLRAAPVGAYAGCRPAELAFVAAVHGKPGPRGRRRAARTRQGRGREARKPFRPEPALVVEGRACR
jgi:hypothetical protein